MKLKQILENVNFLKSVVYKTGKDQKEVEDYWEKAKEKAKDKFKESDKAFWPYANSIFMKMTGYKNG